jgi:hypothetical protein
MKSYEALQKAIAGKTAEHARRLHLSTITVNKWQEPTTDFTDSGAFNCLDRIETIVQTALDLGIPKDDAFAPIYYLNTKFGLNAVMDESAEGIEDLSMELVETLREVGHLTTAATDALSTGEITQLHARKIEEEGTHLIRRVSSFIKKTRELTRKKLSLKLFSRKAKEAAGL